MKQKRVNQRKLNGIPVREARAAIHVQPNKEDIRGATREDPENCAYARCLRRTLDCKTVFVFLSFAYIETLDEKGNPIIERYNVRKHAKAYLLKFDHGEKVEPGGFVFHVPPPAKTLDYKMADYRRRKAAGKPVSGPRKPGVRGPKAKEYSLRNGKGAVHFITAEQIKVNRGEETK
jgi:hypothetical protein